MKTIDINNLTDVYMLEAIVMPQAAMVIQPGQQPEAPSTMSIPMRNKPNPQQVGELLNDLCNKTNIDPSQIVSIQIRHLMLGKEIWNVSPDIHDSREPNPVQTPELPANSPASNVISLDKNK